MIIKEEEENYFIKNDVLYRYKAGMVLLFVQGSTYSEIINKVNKKGYFALKKIEKILKKAFF